MQGNSPVDEGFTTENTITRDVAIQKIFFLGPRQSGLAHSSFNKQASLPRQGPEDIASKFYSRPRESHFEVEMFRAELKCSDQCHNCFLNESDSFHYSCAFF